MNNVGINKAIDEEMYVTISISDELYGIDVTKVQEITGISERSHVPNALPYMKGVTNLRGKIIPLVDLRVKFDLPEKEYDKQTVIMIVEIKSKTIGIIVDSVSDVVNIPMTDIQNTPHFSANIESDCIKGVGQIEEKIVIIMDVDKIFTNDELENIE